MTNSIKIPSLRSGAIIASLVFGCAVLVTGTTLYFQSSTSAEAKEGSQLERQEEMEKIRKRVERIAAEKKKARDQKLKELGEKAKARKTTQSVTPLGASKLPLLRGTDVHIFPNLEKCIYADRPNSPSLFFITTAPFPEEILTSKQLRSGLLKEAHVKRMTECGFARLERETRLKIAFHVADSEAPYAIGSFQVNGLNILSNIRIEKFWEDRASAVNKEALARLLTEIDGSARKEHVYSSVKTHVSEQVSSLLKAFCKKAPVANPGHIPGWEKDECVIRTSSTGTYLYHWSGESDVTHCTDDLSSCQYEFQIICNSSYWDGKKAYCRDQPKQRGKIDLN